MNIREIQLHESPPMDLLLMADPSQKLVAAYLEGGDCYVLEEKDQIIGVYVLIPTRTGTVELINIAVAETAQGKGIGKLLVMDALKRARRDGFKIIEIGTGNSSIGQLALYQKCGFRITALDRDFFIRHYDTPIYENGIWCRDMIRLSQEL